MNTRFAILSTSMLLVTACSSATQSGQNPFSSDEHSSSGRDVAPVMRLTKTYENKKDTYAIKYPDGFTLKQNNTLNAEDYSVTGTAFAFPKTYEAKSTLDDAEVHVATAKTCPALNDPQTITINNVDFQQGDWTGVGAGNLYEGRTVTTYSSGKCYVISLMIHSCNLGPDCSPGHTDTFKRQPIKDLFDQMVGTFKLL